MEHVVRNGRSVAGFGVGAPSEAEAALHSIKVRLDRPPWLRAISITSSKSGDVILIEVQRPEHVPIAQMIVGDRVNMVPVHYEAGSNAGVGIGALWSPDWRNTSTKLAAMERLIAEGRGDTLVEGGGCTEPGGGIVPTQRTALEMAKLLRKREHGLGDKTSETEHHWPWKDAVVMSVAGALTGWVLEEIARRTFRRKR